MEHIDNYGILASISWNSNGWQGEHKPMLYLVNEPGFDEIEFLGHVMGIATSRLHATLFESYFQKSAAAKEGVFKSCREIKKFNDLDVTLSVLN